MALYDPDAGVRYIPYTDPRGAVGFRAEREDGRVEFILLNPSGGPDDGVPTVFVYIGPHGDVGQDGAATHFEMFDGAPTPLPDPNGVLPAPPMTSQQVEDFWAVHPEGLNDVGQVRLRGGTLDVGILYVRPSWWRRLLFPSVRRQERDDDARRTEFFHSLVEEMGQRSKPMADDPLGRYRTETTGEAVRRRLSWAAATGYRILDRTWQWIRRNDDTVGTMLIVLATLAALIKENPMTDDLADPDMGPIDPPVTYLPIREFVDLGCLMEINRLLLHPRGLALEWDPGDYDQAQDILDRFAPIVQDLDEGDWLLEQLEPILRDVCRAQGDAYLSGVWDDRADPEGTRYSLPPDLVELAAERAATFAGLAKTEARRSLIGLAYDDGIQPLDRLGDGWADDTEDES